MRYFLILAALLALDACRCGPVTNKVHPDVRSDPTSVAFESCPSVDDTGKPVADVFPDQQTIHLSNAGKVDAALTFKLTGADAAAFQVMSPPDALGPTSEIDVTLQFTAKKPGDHVATLEIDDGDDTTDVLKVNLDGVGTNLPAQPTLEVQVQNSNNVPCTTVSQCGANQACREGTCWDVCFEGGVCSFTFPDTFYKESSSQKVWLHNAGCPALKISKIDIQPLGTSPAAYYLDQPGVPPTDATPILLSPASANAETELVVRFSPLDDDPNCAGRATCSRNAQLTLSTNDPNPDRHNYPIVVAGTPAFPALDATPTICDFTDPTDPCGNLTKQQGVLTVKLTNNGNVPITIDAPTFLRGGVNGRFALDGATSPTGKTLDTAGANQSTTFNVKYTDAPLYVSDVLTVSAHAAGGQSGGQQKISLFGGIKPCLSTSPADELDFVDAGAGTTTKTVMIQNGTGCGDLIINNVTVDQNAYFSISSSQQPIPKGTTVPAGTATTAYIDYKKPVIGGSQTGILRIDTNDSDYGAPSYKVVRLYSEAPLDQLPISVIEGCNPKTDPTCATPVSTSMSVSLSALGTPPKTLKIIGTDSYDPPNNVPVSQYKFTLVAPSNAVNASMQNDKQKTATGVVTLTLDPTAVGLYTILLDVWDNAGQQSPQPANIKISVTQ